METTKIIVTGSREVGKRTFIETISETVIFPSLPGERSIRDVGRITIDDEHIIYLFGYYDLYLLSVTPDLNDIIHGFLLLIDSTDEDSFYEAKAILKYLTLLDVVPHIVVANKQDREDALTVGQIRREMGLPDKTPMMACVATHRESVRHVLLELLFMIRPDLQT